ncbi:MAG: hypothetical protein ACHP7B_05880 [Burkholderiales bacterium]
MIAAPEILVMPGVHDALGARLAEAAGFSAVTAGLSPLLPAQELQSLGYAVVVFPVAATYAVA